jgi:anti-sigma factor RsiW
MSRRCEAFEPWLSAWVDGELNRGERARVGAHLQRCPKCRAEIASLRVTQSLLRSLPQRGMPVTVAAAVAAQAQDGTQPRPLLRTLVRTSVGALVLAVMVGAAGFVAGSEPPQVARATVPVDIYVADHMVRAVGGAVSTPALVEPKSGR